MRQTMRPDARFIQPREPAFWLYLAIVVATGFFAVGQQALFRMLSPAGWALSWGLLALYALPVVTLVLVLDLYQREPISLIVASLVWGGVAATTLAAVANAGWALVVARIGGPAFAARWTAAITAPPVEETMKGVGVVLLCLIASGAIEDEVDGFIYGAMCGLGFAIVEDVFYFMGVFGGQPSGVLRGFLVRVVASGLYSHVFYSAIVGMGIGYVVSREAAAAKARRLWVCAGLCAVAVLGHFLWDSPLLDFFPREPWTGMEWLVVAAATAVKVLPLLGFVAMAVSLARGRERRWVRGGLGDEVGFDGILADELALLESPQLRRAARLAMRRRAGSRAARLLHRLQREQITLAMLRSKAEGDEDPALVRQREYCRSLRDALRAIPGAAPAGTGAG
ncbi:MAG: PrsW family intramembrane metalloprotease [Actinomycetota bacterium]|nr:PrsW family intramembrane metalloprotease [Actinomycetota bacterium]